MDDERYVQEYEEQTKRSDGWITLLNRDRLIIILIKKLNSIEQELMTLNQKI